MWLLALMSCSSSKRLFQAARQTNWLQHTNGDSCTRCRKKTAATWIAFQRLGGVFNSRVVVAEAQLALGKVEMEWYFHRVESYKVFVARFLPAWSSRNMCALYKRKIPDDRLQFLTAEVLHHCLHRVFFNLFSGMEPFGAYRLIAESHAATQGLVLFQMQ